jgi:hypothetical protein
MCNLKPAADKTHQAFTNLPQHERFSVASSLKAHLAPLIPSQTDMSRMQQLEHGVAYPVKEVSAYMGAS